MDTQLERYKTFTAFAACWSGLFEPAAPQAQMAWAGLFEQLAERSPKTDFYNFYSPGDEVFELREEIETGVLPPQYRDILHWEFAGWAPWDLLRSLVPYPTFSRYAWQKQEFLKGTHAVFGTADGGWLFAKGLLPFTRRYSAEEANALLAEESGRAALRAEPVFNAPVSMLRPASDPQARELERFEILAYRIPALSPAMGITNDLTNKENIRMKFLPLEAKNCWPTRPAPYKERWLHSDIKNMAYRYVREAYVEMRKIIMEEKETL